MNAHAPNAAGSMVEHALRHARQGFPVFPCDPTTKRPLVPRDKGPDGKPIPKTGGLTKATTDETQIIAWWDEHPTAMIGLRMGRTAGVFALDPDMPKKPGDPDGMEAWRNLAASHRYQPFTHMHGTPRGGLHILYRYPSDFEITNSPGALPPGIDVRGEGGYVIAPPSRMADGRSYRLEEPEHEFCFEDPPNWILESLRKPEPQSTSERAKASAEARGGRIHEAFANANEPDPFWKNVNGRALANLDAWVPVLIPSAQRAGGGTWRVTSRDLGRDRQEDLSISPDGIKDFGVWDVGDPNEGKRTHIALVLEYRAASTAADAALWLCAKIGVAPEVLGWRGGRRDDTAGFQQEGQHQGADSTGQAGQQEPQPAFKARPFVWIDPSLIPLREWLLERHLIRRFISVTAAPGGVGKSSLVLLDALSLATGRNLIGHQPHGRFNVLLWNGEDPLEEMQRRIVAACLHYDIRREDIEGRLFVNSGRDDPIVVAQQTREGVTIAAPVVEAIKATIRENAIDVVHIDPFVSCHGVSENDNMAIDKVAKLWGKIAHDTGCAVELVHHTRKTGGNETVMEDLRGAVALLSASRSGRILNVMSREEAERADVKQPRLYFRVDNGKANLAPPPSEGSAWFKLESVPLMNGGTVTCGDHGGSFALEGDSVGVVAPWEWPDPLAGMTPSDLCTAQAAVRAGGPWRENIQAKDWIGIPIAHALRLDPTNKAHRERIKRMLKIWIENKMFVVVTGKNEKGRPTPFVEAGEDARS